MAYAYPQITVCIGLPLLIFGFILLNVWLRFNKKGRKDRTTQALLITSIVAIGLAVSTPVVQIYWYYSDVEAARHVTLDYDARLSINGTGTVRVSLPVPANEKVFQNALIQPSGSVYSLNRTGAETMLDIVMSQNTTIHASLYGLRGEIPVDLTRTTALDLDCFGSNCTSEINMTVLGGMVADVHVILSVRWSSGTCLSSGGGSWELDCNAIPGRNDYRGYWMPKGVC